MSNAKYGTLLLNSVLSHHGCTGLFFPRYRNPHRYRTTTIAMPIPMLIKATLLACASQLPPCLLTPEIVLSLGRFCKTIPALNQSREG